MCSNDTDSGGGTATEERLRPLEALEREITELTSQIHAATCRWLCLIAEYDERRGWAEWGCTSCAHWVMWQCGIAPGAAREHVRVARRLREMPSVQAAFADGELSYSKVRALTRLPRVEHEAELLSMARCATASQLERLVRGHRRVAAVERAAAGGGGERWVWHEHDEDGSLLLHARLPAEEGALVLAALDAARERLARADVPAEPPAAPGSSAGDVPAETPAAHGSADQSTPADAPRARDTTDQDVPAETPGPSHASAAGVPAETLGPSHSSAAGVPAETPGLPHASAAGVPAGTHRPPDAAAEDVPAETSGTFESEADGVPAGTPTPCVRETRADALLALANAFLAGPQHTRTGAERHQVVVHVDTATLTDGAGERCELADGEPLPAETARRLACDASIIQVLERDGVPLKLGRKTRTIPPTLRRALAARDRHCRYPGCTAQRFIDAHHIKHWADGGATDLDNLIQLCGHHHRLLHEGRYQITRSGGRLIFRRRDGRHIPTNPSHPPGPPAALTPTRRPDACVSLSTGEPYIFDWAVEALLEYAPIAPGEPPGI